MLVGDRGERAEVGDIEAGIANGLDKDRLGAVIDPLAEALGIVALDEPDVDAEARECNLELVVGAAVEVAGRDDVVARLSERGERDELSRLPARDGEGGDTTLQGRDPLLEHIGRRVHQPRVDVAELLQREQPCAVRAVLERV